VTGGNRLPFLPSRWSGTHTQNPLIRVESELQFTGRESQSRVPAHRSMRRKLACCQRHCSQEHDDGNTVMGSFAPIPYNSRTIMRVNPNANASCGLSCLCIPCAKARRHECDRERMGEA
jgi:hypothetical protein